MIINYQDVCPMPFPSFTPPIPSLPLLSSVKVKEAKQTLTGFAKTFFALRKKAKIEEILQKGYKTDKVTISPTKTSKDLQMFAKIKGEYISPFGHNKGQGNFLDQCLAEGTWTLEKLATEMVVRKLTAQEGPKVIVTRIKNHFRHLEDFHSMEVFQGEKGLEMRPLLRGKK